MASNIVTIPDITSWWFRRVLGSHLVKCSAISVEDDKEISVTPIESAILSSAIKDNEPDKDNNAACGVIGLYFTPVNSCLDEENVEEFTSKLVGLYNRVNLCGGSKCSDGECCNSSDVSGSKKTSDSDRSVSSNKVKTKKLEVIHVVLPPHSGVSAGGVNMVLEPGADGGSIFDETSFRKVLKDLPWFAIPYRDSHRVVRLSRRYRAQIGAPTLVLLEGATGRLITSGGCERLNEDPTGARFPWTPRPLAEVLREAGPYLPGGKRVTSKSSASGSEVRYSELEGLVKGIYFSAHWCPPCKAFTPQLIETYSKVRARGNKFEVIFVSSDRSDESFTLYLRTMPWLAVPWEQEETRRELAALLGVQGIPTLVLLDADGSVITADGRGEVNEDPLGEQFPWRPKLVNILTERYAAKLHDYPAIILFVEGEDGEMEFAQSVLLPAAEQFAMLTDSLHRDEDRLLHFFVGCDCETSDLLREFVGLDDAVPLLTAIDIPGGQLSVMEDGAEITEQSVISFVARFLDGTLPATDITANNIHMAEGTISMI
ncbi:nucleoredoxin-like [Periplaneta americana]|uniref:nucleoredoxin-like n=1 Tax=Periplaneta americana TaxID=6978 RepID=UPI0037E7F4CB